jgi:hypothetical protein
MTNSLPDLALQFHDHAIRRLKDGIRWSDRVEMAERSCKSAASVGSGEGTAEESPLEGRVTDETD